MPREIKIRAWEKKQARWVYFTIKDLFQKIPFDFRKCYANLKNITQFTGLKDENGKEIFEGDIINWTGKRNKGISKFAYRYEVVFERGMFGYHLGNSKVNKIDPICEISELETYEVIGNVFETPELLT